MCRGFVITLLVLAMTECASLADSDGFRCSLVDEVVKPRHLYWENTVTDIGIEVSDRASSQLLAWLFRLVLQEVLGYTSTVLVPVPDHINISQRLYSLSDCTSCSMDPPDPVTARRRPSAVVCLDVGFPPEFVLPELAESRNVISAGRLGPVTRLSWFVSRRLVVEDGSPWMVDHWRTFRHGEVPHLFNYTAEELQRLSQYTTDTNGRYWCEEGCDSGVYVPPWCRAASCAVLLASTPDEAGSVTDQIDRWRLMVQVYWVGDYVDDIVTSRAAQSLCVLFVHYTPSLLTLDHRYSEVAFPSCNESYCISSTGLFMHKLAWAGITTGAAVAHKALRLFKLSQAQYVSLLRLQLVNGGGQRYQDTACQWLRQNRDHWRSNWIPGDQSENVITIGGIFPIGGEQYNSRGLIAAVIMAYQAINANSSLLADFKLSMKATDGQCSPDMVMKNFIDYLRLPEFNHMAGIIGPACSDTVEPVAGVSRYYRVMVISYSAEGALFSNRTRYPYFFRTIGENKQFRFVYKQLFEMLGWSRVAALTESGQKYSAYISVVQDVLEESGMEFIVNRRMQPLSISLRRYLSSLMDRDARIIIADLYESETKLIMCEAYKNKMTARQGFVWFLPEWFTDGWYKVKNAEHFPCTTEQMQQALDGHLSLSHSYFGNDTDIMQEGISVKQWRQYYRGNCSQYPVAESKYAGYAYDAVWTYALALDKLLTEKRSRYNDFHTNDTTNRFVELLSETSFDGVSGHIRFIGPSRVSVTQVKQWRVDRYEVIGHFDPIPGSVNGGRLYLDESKMRWLTPDGKRPLDGSLMTCELKAVAEFLHVSCETAFVLVNVLGLSLVLLAMITCALLFRRRYERKVLRLRELGLASAAELRLDEWEVARESVVLNRKLGEGAFGTVFGGEALLLQQEKPLRATDSRKRASSQPREQWVSVAVKTLKLTSTIEEKLDFLAEADAMKKFNHVNIIQLLGVCTRSEPILTVMEFMLYGDLKTFLLSRRSLVSDRHFRDDHSDVSSRRLTSMARDVASALAYLADRKYVHRDVACRNCLVNAQHIVKLADFGMTRSMCENDYYRFNRKGMLPVRWMAPESLSDGLFTPASDMWSYGVLLYEMVTFGSFPFQGLSNNEVVELVRAGQNVGLPPGASPELGDLLLSCWCVDPDRRPDSCAVVELLGLQYPRLLTPCLHAPVPSVLLDQPLAADPPLVFRTRSQPDVTPPSGRQPPNTADHQLLIRATTCL